MNKENFFDHYFSSQSSKIGNKIEIYQSKKILDILIKDKIIKKKDRILEIGTANGIFANECKRFNINYKGIEANKKQYEKLIDDGFIVINIKVPPINLSDKFNLIYLAHLLEHMESLSKAEMLISDIRNTLTDKGFVVIISPNYLSWKNDFWNCDYTHNYVTSPRRVIQLLTNNGFEIKRLEYFCGPLFGKERYLLKIPNKLYPHKLFNMAFGRFFHDDFFYKAKMTFYENFIIVARKL